MNYKIESDFEYKGYRCVVVFQRMGHRCGYVGITNEHPLHGVGYGDKAEVLKKSDIENQPIGNRGIIPLMCMDNESEEITPDCYFNVHGGITYAGGGETYPVESDNLWWFGFDCAHYDDSPDYYKAKEYQLENEDSLNRLIEIDNMYHTDGVIRTQEYVEQECKNLADQLGMINQINI